MPRLVIDACVARAAGGADAVHPTASRCRDFLIGVRDGEHVAVFSSELITEWNQHQSGFARRWRVQMVARKRLQPIPTGVRGDLRERACLLLSLADQEALLKDMHLVEAALATDRRVISIDETMRTLLNGIAERIGELRTVHWFNPDVPGALLDWLANGAPVSRETALGAS